MRSADWQFLNAVDSLVRFCVPVFFMVSGALFLDPRRHVTVRSILTKSLPRLMIPFAVWSAFYALLLTFGPGGDLSLSNLVARFVLGHYHLWFLIALAGLYLVTPLIRPWVSDRRLLWYFVVLAVMFASALPLAVRLPVVGELLAPLADTLQLHLVLGYTVYFVLGYLIHTSELRRRTIVILMIAAVGGVVVTALGTSWLSLRTQQADGSLYGYLTPNVMIVAVAVFALISYVVPRRRGADGPAPRLIGLLSSCSLGIYLVHPFFQELYTWLGFPADSVPASAAVPLLVIAVVIPSVIVAGLIRRIPRLGNWIS